MVVFLTILMGGWILRAIQKQEEWELGIHARLLNILQHYKNNNNHTRTNTPKVYLHVHYRSTFRFGYVYLENMTIPAYYCIIRRVRVVKQINK
jgi:hypothetical protein